MKNNFLLIGIFLLIFSLGCKKNIECTQDAPITYNNNEYSIYFHTALLYMNEEKLELVGYTSLNTELYIYLDRFGDKDIYNKEEIEDIYRFSRDVNTVNNYLRSNHKGYSSFFSINTSIFEISNLDYENGKIDGNYNIHFADSNKNGPKSNVEGEFKNICLQIIE